MLLTGVLGLMVGMAGLITSRHLSPVEISDEQGSADILAELNHRKLESLKHNPPEEISGERIHDFAGHRIAFLVSGEATLTIESSSSPDAEAAEKDFPEFSLQAESGGSATAITSDGYWLTAAHCLATPQTQLLAMDHVEKTVELAPIRAVWIGSATDSEIPDIALFHSTTKPTHFSLPQPGKFPNNIRVLAVGFGGNLRAISSGTILRRTGWKGAESGPRWNLFTVDIPVGPGDSGGPAFDLDGRLLGINTQAVPLYRRTLLGGITLAGSHARCTSPHPSWIRELIEEDRSRQKEGISD